ncbi:adenine phosphoribosyltransferase [Kytococcus aerolatus]|uniref:Adenine phosphoribosyltransferase n=1 Tax=Kytococcus aerolatus TaxID=592308 RepID=A0A212T372_9MICO|nr:adenine phosphoribosyltransferase [Kytococcus aerolatus]SNC60300.1 adenine phosphoribosyltransferase [Kytococcus aerolatus]
MNQEQDSGAPGTTKETTVTTWDVDAEPQGEELRQLVASRLRAIPDFPEPGVVFKDFTPLLRDPAASRAVVADVVRRRAGAVDVVVGIEARGFILGSVMAHALGVGFVPVRKAGKLPGETHRVSYSLEYGEAVIEMHQDALQPGDRVLVVDDVLATGGTAAACCQLVEACGATVAGVEVVLELAFLHGRDHLPGYDVVSLLVDEA